jgi:hypothetical protein
MLVLRTVPTGGRPGDHGCHHPLSLDAHININVPGGGAVLVTKEGIESLVISGAQLRKAVYNARAEYS